MYYIIKIRCIDSEGEECDRYIGEKFWTTDNLEEAEKFGRYTNFSLQDFCIYINKNRELINHYLKFSGCKAKQFVLIRISFTELAAIR